MAETKDPSYKPPSPRERKALQDNFTRANQVAATGGYEYAVGLLTICVTRDPGNKLYAQAFLSNLQKQYDNNPGKIGQFKKLGTATSKASMRRHISKGRYVEAIKLGVEVLKVNPWDTGGLVNMAQACEGMEFHECELFYFDNALMTDKDSVDLNRKFGITLERLGEFDRATNCWRRVLEQKPQDEEAKKKISDLSVRKTIDTGYEDADSTKDARRVTTPMGRGDRDISPEERLEKELQRDPSDISKYLELAGLYRAKDRWKEARDTLQKATEASGGDHNIQEKFEDAEMTYRERQTEKAKVMAQEDPTEERIEMHQKLSRALNRYKLDVYRKRAERSPENLTFHYELARCFERSKMVKEAIASYQKARGDEAHKGEVLYGLGRCFASIKQYRLALNHLKEASTLLKPGEDGDKISALYMTGVIAMDMLDDLDTAQESFTKVASLDFSYKDVAERLDKLS
ncbi:Hypothetical protein PBC10988_9740 [Planctomycetales bacterium 10988]|nr:Hypothetical protein PBC10988_9740 [Planctomycetales bacterium 10988]